MNIVITGASRGLGKAITTTFAGDGQNHTFFLSSRNKETLDAAANELQENFPGTKILSQAYDLSDKKNVLALASWVLAQTDKPDILVNNAGIFLPGNVHDEREGLLEEIMNVNLFSAYHLTRKLLPAMMKQKSGHIFNICSIASLKAYENGGAYSISKFALAGFSKNLREEMKPHGIKVTSVYPGAAYTDSWAGFVKPERIMEATDVSKMIYAASQLSPQACVEEIIMRPQLGDV